MGRSPHLRMVIPHRFRPFQGIQPSPSTRRYDTFTFTSHPAFHVYIAHTTAGLRYHCHSLITTASPLPYHESTYAYLPLRISTSRPLDSGVLRSSLNNLLLQDTTRISTFQLIGALGSIVCLAHLGLLRISAHSEHVHPLSTLHPFRRLSTTSQTLPKTLSLPTLLSLPLYSPVSIWSNDQYIKPGLFFLAC